MKYLVYMTTVMMFMLVLVAPISTNAEVISRNIMNCEQIDLENLISYPIDYFGKNVCFEGKLVKEAGIFKIDVKNASLNERPVEYTIRLNGSNRQEQLLEKFETGTSLFFKGEIDVEELYFEREYQRKTNSLKYETEINFNNFNVFFESTEATENRTRINDYYTFNINECMLVELKDIFAAPLKYNGKRICGYETLRTSDSRVFLSEDIEDKKERFFNEDLIFLDALYDDYMYLFRNSSERKIFFYGVLDLHKACWGIGGSEKADCSPYSKPIYLLYPNIIFLENTN